MRFTYTRRTENKKRVECLDCRIVGNRFAYGSRNLVTLTEAVVLECIAGVKLRIEFGSRFRLKRVRRLRLALRHDRGRRLRAALGYHCRRVVVDRIIVIEKLYPRTVHFLNPRTQHIEMAFFELIYEELRLHHQHKSVVLETHRSDVPEPGVVLLRRDVVLYEAATFAP